MKKLILNIVVCTFIVLLITGCEKQITGIDTNIKTNCNFKAELLLKQKDKNIYTYCLESATINLNNRTVSLKKYIENEKDAIDKIIGTLELKESFSDGGTNIYRGDNITVIKCNTLDGNKDIYIGNENLIFKQNFCDNDNYTFVRVYKIKSINEYTKQQYTDDGTPVSYSNSFEVELEEYQGETNKVIINNLLNIKLEVNKTYEFEFQLYEDAKDVKDTIQYIFKNSNIIDIREINKLRKNQTQEPIKQK